jgi:hypothetical protein
METHRQTLHKICVLHVDALENAQQLQGKLQEEYALPVYLVEAVPSSAPMWARDVWR